MRSPTSFRLTKVALDALAWLSEHLGLSRTGVLELLIRERVKRERRP